MTKINSSRKTDTPPIAETFYFQCRLYTAEWKQLPAHSAALAPDRISMATLSEFKGCRRRRCGRCCMIYCWPVAAACSGKWPLPRDDARRSVRMRLMATERGSRVKNPCPPAGHSTKPLPFKMSAHIRPRAVQNRIDSRGRRFSASVAYSMGITIAGWWMM